MGSVVCKTMASNASLSGFRKKLVTCIDDLRTRREALNESIREAEMQKIDIENKLPRLSMELSRSKGPRTNTRVWWRRRQSTTKKRMPHGNGSNVAASEYYWLGKCKEQEHWMQLLGGHPHISVLVWRAGMQLERI